MAKHTHLEWLNRNSLRSYPIRENQVLTASDGFELPYDLLVDIKVSTPFSVDSIGVQSVFITPRIISINFCDQDLSSIATVVFPIGDQFVYDDVPLNPLVDGIAGSATCGPCVYTQSASSLMPGHHLFTTPCWLEKTTCLGLWEFPVKSIKANTFEELNGNTNLVFSGDITSSVSRGLDPSNRPSTFVVLELNNQQNYLSKCNQVQNAFECGKTPVITINGVSPDSSGNMILNFVGFDEVTASGSTVLVSKTGTASELCAQESRIQVADSCGYLPGNAPSSDPITYSWNDSFENLTTSQTISAGNMGIISTRHITNPFDSGAILTITGSVDDDIAVNGFVYEGGFFPFMNGLVNNPLTLNGLHTILDPYILEVSASEVTKIDLYNNWGTGSLADLSIQYSPIIPCGSGIMEPYPIGYLSVVKNFVVDISSLLQGNPESNFNYQDPDMQLLGQSYPLSAQTYDLQSGSVARVWQSRTYQNPFKSYATVTITGYADGGVGVNGNIIAYMQGETYQSNTVDPNQTFSFSIIEGDSFIVDWIGYEESMSMNSIAVEITIARSNASVANP